MSKAQKKLNTANTVNQMANTVVKQVVISAASSTGKAVIQVASPSNRPKSVRVLNPMYMLQDKTKVVQPIK